MREHLIFNFKIMVRQKTFQFAFGVMLLICIGLPLFYFMKYFGAYEYELPSADSVFIASNGSVYWEYLSLVLPCFLLLPYGFSYMNEHKSGVAIYIQARNERRNYYYSQMLTCFLGTMIVVTIPFVINIILNSILFPNSGNNEIWGSGYHKYSLGWQYYVMGEGYSKNTIAHGAFFKYLFIDHPQINNLLVAIVSGFILGLIACLFYSISLLVKRGSIWLLLASYLTFQVFHVFDSLWDKACFGGYYINLNILDYCSGGLPEHGKLYPVMFGILIFLTFISLIIIHMQIKKDED